MDVGVLLHVGLLVEPLAAELARVGAGVGVDQQVRGERRRALETLAALAALEAALGRVDGAVLAQTHRVSERLPARAALERTSAAVVSSTPVDLHPDTRHRRHHHHYHP